MTTTKKKKKQTTKKLKRRLLKASVSVAKSDTKIRITRHKFALLKKDDDFVTIIKVGRLINSISFAMQSMLDYSKNESPLGKRQYYRSLFITGGYLYEALQLIDNLQHKYQNRDYFKSLSELARNDSISGRKILQTIRDVAFHLDDEDKSTRAALSKLNLPRYDFVSGNSTKIRDFYFDLADTLDLNYVIDKMKGDLTEPQKVELIMKTLADMTTIFLTAAHDFIMELANELKISDYTE